MNKIIHFIWAIVLTLPTALSAVNVTLIRSDSELLVTTSWEPDEVQSLELFESCGASETLVKTCVDLDGSEVNLLHNYSGNGSSTFVGDRECLKEGGRLTLRFRRGPSTLLYVQLTADQLKVEATSDCVVSIDDAEEEDLQDRLLSWSYRDLSTLPELRDVDRDGFILPECHPTGPYLEALFKPARLIETMSSFIDGGFITYDASVGTLVGFHPLFPSFIVKAFADSCNTSDVLLWTRLEFAADMAEIIRHFKMKWIAVPEKFSYAIPKEPAPRFSGRYGPRSLVVVEDHLDLLGTVHSSRLWQRADSWNPELLRELYTLFSFVQLKDLDSRNVRFTPDGKIAFIDLERRGRYPKYTRYKLSRCLPKAWHVFWRQLDKDVELRRAIAEFQLTKR